MSIQKCNRVIVSNMIVTINNDYLLLSVDNISKCYFLLQKQLYLSIIWKWFFKVEYYIGEDYLLNPRKLYIFRLDI